MTETSTVTALWLYPVQSLRGQIMSALEFYADQNSGGQRFDRWYGIEDIETGKTVGSSSAKRAWRSLITWEASYLGPLDGAGDVPRVEIRFPDGGHVVSDDPEIDRLLSDRLGRPVTFRGRDGTKAESRYRLSPCHLITSATLRRLGELYPSGDFAPERFRPNMVLDCGETTGFIEQAWLGHRMAAASGAVLRGSADCKRCALTTRAQGGLPADPGILHTVIRENNTSAGIYADVAVPGRIALGDRLTVE